MGGLVEVGLGGRAAVFGVLTVTGGVVGVGGSNVTTGVAAGVVFTGIDGGDGVERT